MSDNTEGLRRAMTAELNAAEAERPALEQQYGQVWDTKQLQADFQVHGFLAPFVSVTRKSDGKRGVLMFQHWPRYYFGFVEE